MTQLFTGQAADGQSEIFKHYGEGSLNIYIAGEMGGGTVTVEAQTPDGKQWVPVAGGDITGAGLHIMQAAPLIGRLSLAGSNGASVDAWAEQYSSSLKDRVRGEQ